MSGEHDVNVYGSRLYAPIVRNGRECKLTTAECENLKRQVRRSEARRHAFPGVQIELTDEHRCQFLADQDHQICLRMSTYEDEFATYMRITKVSDLPGIDRVLRPNESQGLSDPQRRMYLEFTKFLMSVDVRIIGTFSCGTRLKDVENEDYYCQLVGDRPVPIFVECIPIHVRITKVLDFEVPDRVENALYHVSKRGRTTIGDIPEHITIIYVGCSNEDEDDVSSREEQVAMDNVGAFAVHTYSHPFLTWQSAD